MKKIRIGCASAFWGDTNSAAAQLVRKGKVHYLVFDYLAEATMSIMAAKRMQNPAGGYATDFVEHVLAPLLPEIKDQRIRIVANAGGVNPLACKKALEALAAGAGLKFKIAVVLGDDLLPRRKELDDLKDLDTGAPLPATLVSLNAYLGAIPIAKALHAGAEIVITGRCVDSALVLGPLMHEFGWTEDDHDLLAAGSVAGHILECGAQATGGNFTDWELVKDGYADMGFPIAECDADGTFAVTKPEGTGGLVSVHTVLEQMLYEIGDPRAYLLPDVVVDFTQVKLEPDGKDRVKVTGAAGKPPTASYKVSATYPAGMRCIALFMIGGMQAAKKGRVAATAIVEKVRRQLVEQKLGDFAGVDIHCIGAEESYGPHARESAVKTREVVVKIAVHHPNVKALQLFSREVAQAATGMAPGFTGYFGPGRPEPFLIPKLASALVPKDQVRIELVIGEQSVPISVPVEGGFVPPPDVAAEPENQPPAILEGTVIQVPLHRLALARSGDKGDHANIGLIPRKKLYQPYLRQVVTADAVKHYFTHVLDPQRGRVERWELPGSMSFNFVLYHALGGGGAGSLRTDPMGKTFGQMLLDFPVTIPALLAASI